MNKQIHFKGSTGSRIALNTVLQLPFFLSQKHKVSAHFKPKGKNINGMLGENFSPMLYIPWGFLREKKIEPILRQGETPVGFLNNAGNVGFILC